MLLIRIGSEVMENIELNTGNFATKADLFNTQDKLNKEIHKLRMELAQDRFDTLKRFVILILISFLVILIGMLAKGFHWF